MPHRLIHAILSAAILTVALSGCGGGNSGGGGGGGGGSGLSISQLSPSVVSVGMPIGLVTVSGQGFTTAAQVLIDGQPAPQTILIAPGTLQVEVNISLDARPGVHQFTVQDGTQTSNSVPYTVYAPKQGPFVMQAMPGFLVGNVPNPPYIVAADVNGDGLPDVIVNGPGLTNSVAIAILYGQADGTLAAPQQVAVPFLPNTLVVGDVDGNGTPDIVSISDDNSNSTTVSTLAGDGHGNFQPAVTQQTFPGSYPGPAYLVDLNGDGKLDLLLNVQQISGTANSLLWLQNTGGAFAPPTTLATTWTNNFAVADFNGDGKPDIVYISENATTGTQTMHILINQGSGQFKDQVVAGMNGVAGVPYAIDFDLDGIPDLVIEVTSDGGSQIYSFKGNGDGSFTQVSSVTANVTQLVVGDFDHDGFPDLAGPGGNEPAELVYLFGDGHGNFTPQNVVGPAGQYAAVGDFNGDGIPDVVVPDEDGFVLLSLGRKNRNFPSPFALFPKTVTAVSTGDITGNGLQDILVGGDYVQSISATDFVNQGNGTFQLGADVDPSSFMLADLTGKGVADLIGGYDNLEIWPNNGTVNFSSSPITFSQQTSDIAVVDMDGDGYPDIVSGTGQIFYGNGSYQFTPVTVASSGFGPYVIGDFNGDGKLDIATAYGTFLNTGNRTFQQVTNSNLPLLNGVVAVVGDFNGDGKDDVALNLPGDPSIGIYYSNGDGTFYLATVLDAGQEPAVMVAGDFNGDGKADLAVGLLSSQVVALLFNAGGGQFTRAFSASGTLAIAMTASDLNHTGKPDLVIGNFVFDFAPPNVNVMFHQ